MKRRSFLKTMGLLAATPLVPKGNTMPQIGDLFAKLASGQSLSAPEIEQLRLQMNLQQGVTSQMAALLTPSGDLDPNIFSHHSGFFSTLPHECASLRFDTQSIDNNSLTTPVALVESPTNKATWNYGMNIDVSNSKILFSGIPGQSIVAAYSWWLWAADTNNQRELTLNTTGGGAVTDRREAYTRGGIGTMNMSFNLRRMAAGESDFNIQVYQNSGGGLNGDGLLVVARLR